MSGGSMDYLYSRVSDAEFKINTIERKAFAKHLKLIAEALHDIEWVDSGDYGEGDENAAIRACLESGVLLETAVEEADTAGKNLRAELERVCSGCSILKK